MNIARTMAGILALVACWTTEAGVFQENDLIMVQGAPTAIHFDKDDEHTDWSWLIGVEWQSDRRWLAGWSYFNNSFDQKCNYIYGGKQWSIDALHPSLYVKLTGGVVLGYKEPYEDKIPFNHDGVAPGIVPALGFKYKRASVQMNLLGTAGLMFTFGFDVLK